MKFKISKFCPSSLAILVRLIIFCSHLNEKFSESILNKEIVTKTKKKLPINNDTKLI